MTKSNDSSSSMDVCAVPADLMTRATGTDVLVLASVWSNPYISIVGVTKNAVANIAKYTRLDPLDVDAALRRLEKVNEVVFDPETQEVMAPEWIKYNLQLEEDSPEAAEDQPDLSGMPFSQTLHDYCANKDPNHLFRSGFWLKKLNDAVLNQMIDASFDAGASKSAKSDLLLLGMSLIGAESGQNRFKVDESNGVLVALIQILILERLKRDGFIQVDGHIQIAKPVTATFTKKGLLAKALAQPGDLLAVVNLQLVH